MQTFERLDATTLAAIAVALLTWSSAYAAIAFVLPSLAPAQLAFGRLLIASLCFALLLLVKRVPLPSKHDWPALALLGVIGLTVYHLCLCYAETRIASGTASIIIAMAPAATAGVSAIWVHERLGLRKLVGLAVALVGSVLVVLASGKQVRFEPMAALVLICVLATAIYFVGQRPYFMRSSTLGVTAVTFFAGTLAAAPLGLPGFYSALRHAPPAHLMALVWLGVAPTFIGYLAWNMAIKRRSASQVSSFIYLSPPLAVLLGWLWLGEQPKGLILVGGALTVSGVVLVNARRRVAPAKGLERVCEQHGSDAANVSAKAGPA
ncbi:MAG: DMT family transporter [Dyella sp.]